MVLAGNLQPAYSRIRLTLQKGLVFVNFISWLDNHISQPPGPFVHSDCIHGDVQSLSDGRLKTERTEVSGQQAQNILNQIKSYTYSRSDILERRLGLIAQEVQSAVDQLAIDDHVVSSKWHNDDHYKTLDYSRLVSLIIPAVNTLAKRVEDLESKLNGNSS